LRKIEITIFGAVITMNKKRLRVGMLEGGNSEFPILVMEDFGPNLIHETTKPHS
jgi:hypothetical protein